MVTDVTNRGLSSRAQLLGGALKFFEVGLTGGYLIEPDFHLDARGSFGRTFCAEEFLSRGLDPAVSQCSLSSNRHKGTLRGLHFQSEPAAEVKLVRVQRGAIWDVIVDLRKNSSTFAAWRSATLTALNAHALYVPKGFAHGFITLDDDTEVFYQMSVHHVPHLSRGVRWDDPQINIAWPILPTVISDKDQALPLLTDATPWLSC
jgi:dTDP-4-dehydrorhamnose 3,5-epimerase